MCTKTLCALNNTICIISWSNGGMFASVGKLQMGARGRQIFHIRHVNIFVNLDDTHINNDIWVYDNIAEKVECNIVFM